jgi:hypothetical protein
VNAVQHLRNYGTFSSPINLDRGRPRSRGVLNLEPEILQAVEEEPNVSCRRFALRIQFHNLENAARTEIILNVSNTENQKIHHVELHFVNGFFKKSTKNLIF